MYIDGDSFRQTASAVRKLNPHARTSFPTDESLYDYMVAFAHRELADRNGYGGTSGFIISTYTRPDGKDRGAYASVAGHTANNLPTALGFAEAG